jgi:multidrug resistance efflux pump
MAIDDPEERLRPGMTATIRVAVETLSNVLLVPRRRCSRTAAKTSSTSSGTGGRSTVAWRSIAGTRITSSSSRAAGRRDRRLEGSDAAGGPPMKARYFIAAIAAMALVGGAAVFGLPDLSPAPDRSRRRGRTHGDIDVKVHTLGELGPLRSQTLAAPSVGGTLQIVTLSPAGSMVHEGDVVLEFDRAEQQYNLQQAGSELAEAEQEIVKLEADSKVQAAQDKLNLLHAQHEVRRAEINVSGNEFVGKIEAEKNNLALEEARRNLAQLDADIKTHAATNRAGRAVVEEKRSKARIAANFARKNIDNMTLRAPLTGLVVIKENQNASGGFGFPGMSLPDYRQGDTVQPGSTIAEVVDLTEMEVKTKIPETERASVNSGVPAKVQVEAIPGTSLAGSSKGVGGLAQNAFWEPQTTRQFSTTFALSHPSSLLRPG